MIHRFAQHTRFVHTLFVPRKPRHPLVRFGLGLAGLGLLALLVFLGLFVGIAMLIGGALYRLWRLRGRPVAQPPAGRVLDGRYRLVRHPALKQHAS